MSLLDSMELVSSDPVPPMMITIMGDAGTCKTSLGALFPNPLIVRLEDGTKALDEDVKAKVMQTPVLSDSAKVIEWLSDIYNEPSNVKSIIFDSVTKMNSIIEDQIVASDPKKPAGINTACGGYGAGHNAVARVHRSIKEWCDALLRDRGINIVFIAHTKIETLDTPDLDPYARYTMSMNKASFGVYVNDVDMVAHMKLKTVVLQGSSDMAMAKAKSLGGVVISAVREPSSLTKNRYNIEQEIQFERGLFPFQSIIDTGKYVVDYKVNKETGEVDA